MGLNTFDTEQLGFTVLEIESRSELPHGASVHERGMAHLIHATPFTDEPQPDYSCRIVSLDASSDTFAAKIEALPSRYQCQCISDAENIVSFRGLIEATIHNRFSEDPRIGKQRAIDHKIKLMSTHFLRGRSAIAMASLRGEIIGFHQIVADDTGLMLYEVATSIDHRNGLLAVALLQSAFRHLRLKHPIPPESRLRTKIYENNLASMSFFSRLGFQPRETLYHSHFHFS